MYTKTQWVDNTTPIDKDNLNKIEQGIYDNSLVVDAVTNTINPTDTETYKTAELTEGQITDVIGVSDILIKGDTEQDGTPTPSAPVDVNVVSGSNTVNTSNKNHFVDKTITFSYIDPNTGYETYNGDWRATSYESNILPNTTYNFSWESNNGYFQCLFHFYDKQRNHIESIDLTSPNTYSKSFTTPSTLKYYRISYAINVGGINVTRDKIQLELGNSRTTYEPHQGKELPLDLGSIELCKIGNYQDYFYKFENDWYLHKEINKIASYNGETITTSYISTTGELSTGAKVYYVVNSTNTKITDTTLISQLEAIYNAPLYEETNITQENNDLPMVLDITACKDNINGIKAWIRR